MRVVPLTTELVPAWAALFGAAHSGCYCRYWHFGGTKNEWLARCAFEPEANLRDHAAGVASGDAGARGVVALEDDGRVSGWLKLTPRAAVPKLRALPVYRGLDLGPEDATYSIGCLLVDPDARGRGVAGALVDGAILQARAWGARAIEAYPRRATEPLHPEEVWQGPEALYVARGFAAVHDVAPYPVYRLALD